MILKRTCNSLKARKNETMRIIRKSISSKIFLKTSRKRKCDPIAISMMRFVKTTGKASYTMSKMAIVKMDEPRIQKNLQQTLKLTETWR